MKGFHPKNIEDFLKHPDFIAWVNRPTLSTDRYWEEWCAKNPDKIHLLQHARELLHGMKLEESNKMDQGAKDQLLDKLLIENRNYKRKRITDYRERMSRNTTFWIRTIAASLLLIGVLFFGKNWMKNQHSTTGNQIAWIKKVVPRGMKKVFTLPDGSVVTVNSGSELSYSSDFENDRLVKLKGQAFFEVTKDPEHPFRIMSGDITTKVLGTSFDVKAYEDDRDIHVAVMTGRVEVKSEAGLNSYLTTGEVTYYVPKFQVMRKADFDYEELIGWKDKVIKFNRSSYHDVFQTLSNWYDVDFVIDPSLQLRGRYTARFKDQSLPNVLIGLEHSSNLKFDIQGNKIVVKRKRQ